ncbi:MAG: hypothetical protein AAFV07_04565 [Bacteroidota bacterium]
MAQRPYFFVTKKVSKKVPKPQPNATFRPELPDASGWPSLLNRLGFAFEQNVQWRVPKALIVWKTILKFEEESRTIYMQIGSDKWQTKRPGKL